MSFCTLLSAAGGEALPGDANSRRLIFAPPLNSQTTRGGSKPGLEQRLDLIWTDESLLARGTCDPADGAIPAEHG